MPLGSPPRVALLTVAALLAPVLPFLSVAPAVAVDRPDGVFTLLSDFVPGEGDRVRVRPREATATRIDLAALQARLDQAPSAAETAAGKAPLQIAIPDPAGAAAVFRIQETRVMQERLATSHPEIRTFSGVGVTDPTATISLDLTPMGFHAAVRGPSGSRSWYVDPATNRPGTTTHLSYDRSAVPAPERAFIERDLDVAQSVAGDAARIAAGAQVKLRTYRLALVTDPAYAAYFGSANVLAEKVTLINRVNQIYNDDLAIKMVLVNGTEKLNLDTEVEAVGANGPCGASACYDRASFYPDGTEGDTPDGCTGALLTRNIFVLGQLIGAENFDVGHIGLGINGGGIAGLGVVGESGKARGCTGLPTPRGDFYAVDYVAHEIGHQFGGNHTFDGTEHNCSSLNRSGATSVEPGSGSSVMAYAGICRRDNLQPHSDPYFSQRSIDEITAHVTGAPAGYDEQQMVTLRGFDTAGETFQLTYPGKQPVTITRGPTTYSALTIAEAVRTLTGATPEVTGYDGAGQPDDNGFTLDFTTISMGTDVKTLGVVGVGDVTGFAGTHYNGGPGTNQGVASNTGNRAPQVTAPQDKTIPARTPFTLTATGTDADGQPLSYLWEQNDTGNEAQGTALLSNNKTTGPLFRVFGTAAAVTREGTLQSPSPGINLTDGGPSRTFPDLAQVVAGNTNAVTGSCPAPPPAAADPANDPIPQAIVDCYSEFLPTASYGNPLLGSELNFRVTARDRFAGGGGTQYDDVTLTVDEATGPFLVTSRATPRTSAQGGSMENVTWAVNGTIALAPQVRITLSTDGGVTFPRVLTTKTPNDGSHTVTLPDADTNQARLRIEAIDNYFFDVSDADFAISSPISLSDVAAQTVAYSDRFPEPVTFTASADDADGDDLVGSVAGVDGLTVVRRSASADGVRPGTATFEVLGPVLADPGEQVATLAVTLPGQRGSTAESGLGISVLPEDATVSWSAPRDFTTETDTTPVTLATAVTDAADGQPGAISRARVTFVDRATGTPLCSSAVTGSSPTGSASCAAELAASDDGTDHLIGTVVSGSHARDDRADDITVTIRKVADTTPDTRVTSGPQRGAFVLTGSVRFGYASEGAASFRCTLDGQAVDCPDGAVRLRRLAGGTHVFTVAGRHADGSIDPTPARRMFVTPYDDDQLRASAGWTRRRDDDAYRGDFVTTSRSGASLTRRVSDVRQIALVVGTAPRFGGVAVYLGKRRLRTVDLGRPRGERVLIQVAKFDRPRSGRLRLVSITGKRVRIEGLGAG